MMSIRKQFNKFIKCQKLSCLLAPLLRFAGGEATSGEEGGRGVHLLGFLLCSPLHLQYHLQLPAIIRLLGPVARLMICERIGNQQSIQKSKIMLSIRDQQKQYRIFDDPLQQLVSNTFSSTLLATTFDVLQGVSKI